MSLAEMQEKVAELSREELETLRDAVDQRLSKSEKPQPPQNPLQFMGSLRGTITYAPGWDEPEPLETWEAYRDTPL